MTTMLAPQSGQTVQRRPGRSGVVAALWAGGYAALALVWTASGDGFPFGRAHPQSMGPLRALSPEVGAPVFAAGLIVTCGLMAWLAWDTGRRQRSGRVRALIAGGGYLIAGFLLLAVPETDVLALAGYLPILLIGLPFGVLSEITLTEVFTWPLINQVICVVGGFLVAVAVRSWQRRTAPADTAPGRWSAPDSAARWGRWAVAVAMAVPLLYAVTRFAWFVGIPLLATDELVADLHDGNGMWAGMGLGAFAAVGAVLTWGLVRPWGERFPRWMIGLAGRPVPVKLAVVPATVVSALVTAASLGLVSEPELYRRLADGEMVLLPMVLWPAWGVALGAAALAYHLRRRGESEDQPVGVQNDQAVG